MVGGAVMLCPVVCEVECPGSPYSKLLLAFAISQPVEPHVHCLRASWLDFVGDDANGCGVVSLCRGWWLWVAHLFEHDAHGHSLACVDVDSSQLGLGGRSHDSFDDGGHVEDGAVVRW